MQLILVFSFLTFFSFSYFAKANSTNLISTTKTSKSFKDSKQLRNRFHKIIHAGQTKAEVIKLMGNPTRTEGEVWFYFENRAPKAGEKISQYEIVFLNNKVRKAQLTFTP